MNNSEFIETSKMLSWNLAFLNVLKTMSEGYCLDMQFYELSDGSKFVEERRVFGVEDTVCSEYEGIKEGYSAEQQGIKSDFFSIEHGRR